jgi:hypothetical protein
MGIARGKMVAEAAGFEAWDRLTDEQTKVFKPAASIMMGQMGSEHHAKALVLKRGIEWGSLDLAGRAEMVSAAMSKLGQMGSEHHAKVFVLTRGVELELLDKAGGRAEMVSAAMRKLGPKAYANALELSRGFEWELLDHAVQAEMVSAAMRDICPRQAGFGAHKVLRVGVVG